MRSRNWKKINALLTYHEWLASLCFYTQTFLTDHENTCIYTCVYAHMQLWKYKFMYAVIIVFITLDSVCLILIILIFLSSFCRQTESRLCVQAQFFNFILYLKSNLAKSRDAYNYYYYYYNIIQLYRSLNQSFETYLDKSERSKKIESVISKLYVITNLDFTINYLSLFIH